jgi:hypothetical protein
VPLNLDAIVQSNHGNFNATSGSVSLGAETTADSTVVICAMSGYGGGADRHLVPPAGFAWASFEISSSSAHTNPYVFYKKTAGGETSWTLAFAANSAQVCWAVLEVAGLDLSAPVHGDSSINPFADTAGLTTNSTGTTPAASSYDVIAFAVHPTWIAGTTPVGIDGHTNSFAELVEESRDDGTNSVSMSVSMRSSQALSDYECTASFTAACHSRATLVVFTAEGAKWAPAPTNFTGFEFGTNTTLTLTTPLATGTAPFDVVTGTPAIVTTSPRTGTYCAELTSTAAAEALVWANPGALIPQSAFEQSYPLAVARLHFYLPTSAPAADTELASVEVGSLANGVTLWYRTASAKIGVKVGTGTEVLSDATIPTNTWVGVDLRYDPRATTHTCDWAVDYDSLNDTAPVDQTQASGSGMTVGNITAFRLGWTTSKTATVRYDDVAISPVRNNYPIGAHNVRLLKVDPSGTPTTDGDTDWRVFTNNGTLAAWTAAGARGALDEIPPVVGGTSDGITQINVNGTNFAHIPLETYTAAPTNVLRALKAYLVGWAASGNPATLVVKVNDGSNTMTLLSLGDHAFDSSAMTWVTQVVNPGVLGYYILTQAKLDAMQVEFGGSNDANPDVGIHAVFAELMTQPAAVYNVVSIEDGAFTVDVRQDPVSAGVASYIATVPAGTRGATFTVTVDGVADDPHYITPNASLPATYERAIGATSIEQVTSVGLTADPPP